MIVVVAVLVLHVRIQRFCVGALVVVVVVAGLFADVDHKRRLGGWRRAGKHGLRNVRGERARRCAGLREGGRGGRVRGARRGRPGVTERRGGSDGVEPRGARAARVEGRGFQVWRQADAHNDEREQDALNSRKEETPAN